MKSHLIALVVFLIASILSGAHAAEAPGVKVDWLDHASPATPTGISFGVPWPRGAVQKGESLHIVNARGESMPAQTWSLAYWPDGSLKWTGHAIVADAGMNGPFTVEPGNVSAPKTPIAAMQKDGTISIDTGAMRCLLTRKDLIESIAIGNRTIAGPAKLVCILEDRSDYANKRTTHEEEFAGQIDSIELEQPGPVRAVVKVTGKHKSISGERGWLPFVVRLYFFAGLDSIRMVHTIVFDGDQNKDFVKGLGIRFAVPMRQRPHNRHVRFAGETGMFAEPLQVMAGRRPIAGYDQQIEGKQLPDLKDIRGGNLVADMAVWDGYKVVQISPDCYTIEKRTNRESSWIRCTGGARALGTAFIGDTSGGISIGMKNFWQQSPTEIEIDKASTDSAEATLWLWSPDAPAMDMRHYDTKGHGLEAAYEDYQQGFASATGAARTNEITIRAYSDVPNNEQLLNVAKNTATPSHLVCSPEYYHSIPVFGVWSLPDRSHPTKAWIEDQLDKAITFYQGQIEQRKWYGFWDFGDVMHSYDSTRHEWRYDIGGFAWANTELMPDLWLWYSFLRTGRGDIFRMAEAMTRHTQEVDVYHLGRFQGLGSRHNVRHWGDGAKELRIAQAGLKRFYYYLTTDERTGDLMDEVIDADERLATIDPLREVEPEKINYPTHARVGPDWFAMCSNWFAAWERTGDTKYRDRIITGAKCMAAMPHKLFSGPSYGYDPKTKMLYKIHDEVDIPHLAALMGGPEAMMEITPLLDLPEWSDAWLNYCQYLQAPRDEQRQAIGGVINSGQGPHFSKMTAYAAWKLNDPKLAERAWQQFLGNGRRGPFDSVKIADANVPKAIDEIPNVSTNNTAQWSLNAIELLELVGKQIPEKK